MKLHITAWVALSVALAALWLAAASWLFLHALGFWEIYPWPDRLWMWGRYAFEAWSNRIVYRWLIITGIVAAAPFIAIGALLVRRWVKARDKHLTPPPGGGLRPLQAGVTDNHGHARWATKPELADRFGGRGCLIGALDRTAQSPLLFDSLTAGPGHSMTIAGPGSHKSTTAVTRIWNWKGPRVVFDPSCEIGPVMTPALVVAGFTVTSIGLDGVGVNVLDWIDIKHPEADAHIRSAVDWIYDEGAASRSTDGARDPFWGMWGRKLVTCLAAHMMFSSDPALPKTLATLRQGMSIPENAMQTLLRGIHATSGSAMARDIAGGLMGMKADETFSSIYSNAFAATEWLSVGAYSDAVSGTAMLTSDILDSRTVVFVQLPLRTLLATPAVGRAVMGAFFNAMFHADGMGITDTILFQIDEAWILGALKEIRLCHATARKYRGAVSTIWQSEGQLEGVWGKDDAKMLRDTVAWRSYNAVQDGSVAEQLSRDIGEHAVMAWSEGSNSGQQRNPMAWMGSKSEGENVSQHEIKRRLIKADEIMRAPADEMFVLVRDFPHPIRCFSAPYFRYPDLNQIMQANRFVREAAE